MLNKLKKKSLQARRASFVIIASKYNGRYVDAMLRAAKTELNGAGAREVTVVRVPGAFEIPLLAAEFASADSRGTSSPDAIICLGVILRGETVHAAHIGENVSRALMGLQLQHRIPIIHEVLLLENEQQAKVRCLDKHHNRGTEAAQTAVSMVRLLQDLRKRENLQAVPF